MPVIPSPATGNDQPAKSSPLVRPIPKRATRIPSPIRTVNNTAHTRKQQSLYDKSGAKSLFSEVQKKPLSPTLSRIIDKSEKPVFGKVTSNTRLSRASTKSTLSLTPDDRLARPAVSAGSVKSHSRQSSPMTMVEEFLDRNNLMNNNRDKFDKKPLERTCLKIDKKQMEPKNIVIDEQKKRKEELRKRLEEQVEILTETKLKLEKKIRLLEENKEEKTANSLDIKRQLRKKETAARDLQKALDDTKEEYRKLESDYESYKRCVKNMILNKDIEIEALKECENVNNNPKCLADQFNDVKKEHDDLQQTASLLREECKNTKLLIGHLKSKSIKVKRLYMSLKNVLNQEIPEPLRCKNECGEFIKETLTAQEGSGEEIGLLWRSLLEKEDELNQVHQILNRPKSYASTETDKVVMEEVGTVVYDLLNSTCVQTQEAWELLCNKSSLHVSLSAVEVSMPPSSKFWFQSKKMRKDTPKEAINI